MTEYVHGYSEREQERLHDQAGTLSELLHHDTRYGAGERVLEAGCGVGAQTRFLAAHSPAARFVSLDLSAPSLAQARHQARTAGWPHVRFVRGDLYALPFPDNSFDHVFLCFVLEHVTRPEAVLRSLVRVLRPGGTLTVIEGDHGSCFFHPETPFARKAWQCLIDVQAALGGDSLIGRRVYPLMAQAGAPDGGGLAEVRVTRRDVYCDASRPGWMDGFVKKTIIPMVEGVREEALARGMMDQAGWEQGIRDLHATGTAPGGTFCYTFFKGVGVKV